MRCYRLEAASICPLAEPTAAWRIPSPCHACATERHTGSGVARISDANLLLGLISGSSTSVSRSELRSGELFGGLDETFLHFDVIRRRVCGHFMTALEVPPCHGGGWMLVAGHTCDSAPAGGHLSLVGLPSVS